ncbi:MAG: UDP-N-acetylglucosamine 2-epimerase [Nonlabens sp.]|uniref:UDP-N-acetylglucosamine 2-epimerase n=1 Tax=Nonlabens sp. TaxID=1888209 RepID=UPI003EF2DB41
MRDIKKITFVTGTRADFGKIKSLISSLEAHSQFECYLFVTGMHLMPKYGETVIEIERSGFGNIFKFENFTSEETMDLTLAKTINGFSHYVKDLQPDLIIVHGDRVEALAGATVGALNNILVAHIEGGELSGTIDELIRHSVSKLSHIHYVSNSRAKERLIQMGELPASIEVIGSPDVDIMFSDQLPSIEEVKTYYDIAFDTFAICMFHPITTEIELLKTQIDALYDALVQSGKNYLVIYPNNDHGSSVILESMKRLDGNLKFRIIPSLRFEYFLVALKNAEFIIGNSSAGVREAPYYGVPTINIGTRQLNRVTSDEIINIGSTTQEIVNAILNVNYNQMGIDTQFGAGDSASLFMNSLEHSNLWSINHQKQFVDNE